MTVTADPPFPPRLADGVELLGEFKDSGYSSPPSLVRRPDGQVIQLSRLLYLIARQMDGRRGPDGIADQVSNDLGRVLSPGQVCVLIIAKLVPLGIVAGQLTPVPGGPPAATPLLGLRARGTLLPARAAGAVGPLLRPLFYWPVIAAVIGAVAGTDFWVISARGLSGAFGQVLSNPADLLVLAALTIASGAFHECGHAAACRYGGGPSPPSAAGASREWGPAAACRYGGATPGRIGFGIYLVWPSFFTDVTDSYRLSRAGRLRTDLGGVYFNLIFILLLAGSYAATKDQLLLLVIAVTHLEMLQQLLPFVRFDGYFILSDLVGVPDLFARVLPILRHVTGQGPQDPRVTGLRRRSRIVVTAWGLTMIPLLLAGLGYLLLYLPPIKRGPGVAARRQAELLSTAASAHHYASVVVDAIGIALLTLAIAGSVYLLAGLSRRLGNAR